MAKRRLTKAYPRIDKPFQSVADVQDYLERLLRAMEEHRPRVFRGDIHLANRTPAPQDGEDGDLWIQYEAE